jgi:enamine deaminase RidA (YjgF/YER057c/UK114 family)
VKTVSRWFVSALVVVLLVAGTQPSVAKDYITTAATQSRAYSLAVVITKPEKIIYFAGQTGRIGPDGKLITSFAGQANRAFQLLGETLKKAGASMGDIVQMTVFITDVRDGTSFPKIRAKYFPDGKFPGSALIAVSGLMDQAQIEIEGVAVVDAK